MLVAAKNGHTSTVELLLMRGADIGQVGKVCVSVGNGRVWAVAAEQVARGSRGGDRNDRNDSL